VHSDGLMVVLQLAAVAENDDNISEQKRQHGKRVRYGEVIQVSRLSHLDKGCVKLSSALQKVPALISCRLTETRKESA